MHIDQCVEAFVKHKNPKKHIKGLPAKLIQPLAEIFGMKILYMTIFTGPIALKYVGINIRKCEIPILMTLTVFNGTNMMKSHNKIRFQPNLILSLFLAL